MGGNMRLRNKKTGEIADVESLGHAESLKEKYGYQVTLYWKTEYENLSQCKDYHSLAEFNEEWEDYKPAEPLIKDEKIRKAVRAWADIVPESEFRYDRFGRRLYTISKYISSFSISFPTNLDLIEMKDYTLEELCGEEK